MPANPFADIITSDMKLLHKQMIDALLENTALTVPCRAIYEGSKFDDISGGNTIDPIGGKPPGIYLHGGPRFAPAMDDVVVHEEDDVIYLGPIWDSKNWYPSMVARALVNSPEMYIQTMSKISSLVTLKRVSRLVIDTDIEGKVRNTFERYGEPEPCGYGQSSHILTMWKKIG